MGLSSTSGAIERGLDFLYICYDNEGYGNTGQQTSGATPHGARTATHLHGYAGAKKDLFSIWAAHRPTYIATVSPSEPLDLARKLARAKALSGPRLILALAPCPTGWEYDPKLSMEIGRLAVRSGIWPLKEYANGEVTHSFVPQPRVPVVEYLAPQGRFRHLFQPQRDERTLLEIQEAVDRYWEGVAGEK
jgi:pyruvate ferredoxin oxidoreductase beta subunit